MFGREFTGKGHRQHVLPPNPTSYSFEKVGSTKKALGLSGLSVGDEVYWYGGGDDVDTSASGVIVELPAVDPDGRVHSDMAAVEWSDDGYEIVEINNLLNAEHYNIGQGYSQALGSRKVASSLTWIYESPEQSLLGQEGWFANSGDGFHASIFEADGYIQLVPGAQRFDVDIYTDSNNYEHVSVNESGFESVDEAKSFVEGVFERSRVASRTAAGKCPKCDGMGRETYETDTGSLSTQTCKACGGTGQAKEAARRTAFLDTIDLPEPRHRVAGWDWDDHLNGFLAVEAAREFTCACGESVPAPGYTDCRCGRRWNAYTIQANGSKKMIAREVPVRENVVMARTARRKTAAGWNKGTHPDISGLSDEQLQDFIDNVQESIDAGANVGEIMRNKRDRFEEELRSRGRKATRKQAELWEDLDSRDYEAVANALGGYDQAEDYWQDVRSAAPDLVSAIRDLKSDMDQLGVPLKVDQYWNLATRKQAASHNLADVQADPSIVQEYDFVFTSSGRHLIEKVEPVDSQGIMRLHTSAGDVLMVRSRVVG